MKYKNLNNRSKTGKFLEVLLAVGIILVIIAVSYGVTIEIFYLITLCFGLKFNILISTGVWLAMFLVSSVFELTR